MPEQTNKRPRVLIVSSDKYPPFRVDVTILFGRELASRGMVLDWILQSKDACGRSYEVEWGGGTVWVGPTDLGTSRLRRIHKHLLGLAADLGVRKRVRRGDYDVVQVKDKILAALPALWAAKGAGIPFVYWLSFPHPEASLHLARAGSARYPVLYRIRGWVQFRLLYGFILKKADHAFVQSEQMKRDLIGYGIAADKMTPVPMGIDLNTFDAIAADAAKVQVRPGVIGYLGTLAGERRIDFLVRCLARVLEHQPDASLLLVGDGDRPGDVEAIRAEAARMGIADRLTITGFLPQREALRLLSAAAVCVSPFFPTPILNSTSPTKLVEYMALGRPVVANDHPEQRLVLEESRAGICVGYAEDEFAAAIVRILRDPAEADAMGLRGRSYVRIHRDYKRIADVVEKVYRQLGAAGVRQ